MSISPHRAVSRSSWLSIVAIVSLVALPTHAQSHGQRNEGTSHGQVRANSSHGGARWRSHSHGNRRRSHSHARPSQRRLCNPSAPSWRRTEGPYIYLRATPKEISQCDARHNGVSVATHEPRFDVALGLRANEPLAGPHLIRYFSQAVRATPYYAWHEKGFVSAGVGIQDYRRLVPEVIDHIIARGGRIHFNLDHLNLAAARHAPRSRHASNRAIEGNVTAWELKQILTNPTWRAHTIFYKHGKATATPPLRGLLSGLGL